MKQITIYCLLFGILLTGCNTGKAKEDNKVIFVSILPLKYFADKIVGNLYKVEVTVPPGAGPETYSPTPRQMIILGKSRGYFSIGYLGFEQVWLKNFASNNQQLQVFPTSKDIDLIKGNDVHEEHIHPGGIDPHIWSSPKNALIIAKNIFDGMVLLDPQNKDIFQKNLNALLAEIEKVDSTVTKLLSTAPSHKFILFHPALGYFARDYGLVQLSIEFEGKVPSPRHLQSVIETAKSEKIGIVLIQREFDKENAEIIAKETGSKIIQIDPLAYEWPEQMIEIARKISQPVNNQ